MLVNIFCVCEINFSLPKAFIHHWQSDFRLIGLLRGFNVGIELHSRLLPTVSRLPPRYAITNLNLHRGKTSPTLVARRTVCEIEPFTVAQNKESCMSSKPLVSSQTSLQFDPLNYWPKSILVHFRCFTSSWAYWLVHYGTDFRKKNGSTFVSW